MGYGILILVFLEAPKHLQHFSRVDPAGISRKLRTISHDVIQELRTMLDCWLLIHGDSLLVCLRDVEKVLRMGVRC